MVYFNGCLTWSRLLLSFLVSISLVPCLSLLDIIDGVPLSLHLFIFYDISYILVSIYVFT